MTFQGAIGEFGGARVLFARADQRIPQELAVEFELLRLCEREPAALGDWTARLARSLRRHATPQPWSILRVSPNVERKVAAALGPKSRENPHGAGLQVYVPVETYLPANGFRPRTRPLIPGYIFALLPDDDALDIARANHAVREVLCDQGRPVKVRAIDIGAMVLFEATRGFDLTWNAPIPRRGGKRRGRRALRHWVRGQRVPIQEGPFAGFFGEIVKADRADRIEVMVEIFGRASPVELDEEMLGEPQPL